MMLPLEQAYAANPTSSAGQQTIDRSKDIPNDFTRQGEAIRDETLDDLQGIIDSPEDLIGEDIIVQVDDYQPRIIRSSLLEDSGIFVHALISGTPTNPTITVPKIRNIVIRSQKVTTVPQGLPVSVGRITHIVPQNRELTYDNLGTLVIPIRQIPQEGKVPDEIILDIDARIFFDVSEGLFFGPVQDILTAQNLEEWKLTKEDHSFYAGYLQATEVKGNQASFMVYDNQLNALTQTPITLAVGQTSRSLSANRGGYITYGRLFDRYTLRLNSVKSISDKVRLLVNRNGNAQAAYLSEGDDLYKGSSWYVESIASDVKGTSLEVTLKNKVTREAKTLKATKADVPRPDQIQSSSTTQVTQNPKEKEKQDLLKASITEYYALADKKEKTEETKDFSNIVEKIKTNFIDNTDGVTITTKNQAFNLLKLIRNYYAQKRVELEAAINLETNNAQKSLLIKARDDVSNRLTPLENILKQQENISQEPSNIVATDSPVTLYRLAIAEYEHLINAYPVVKDKVVAAHWKIANLALLPGINDRAGAINHLEIMLRNYKPEEYQSIATKETIQKLLDLLNSLQSDFQSAIAEVKDPSTNDIFYVTLIGGSSVPDSQKSKATIEVEGYPAKEYREGEQLLQDDKDQLKWFVKEIRDSEIILIEDKTKQQESLTKNQAKSINTGTNTKRNIKLTKADMKKEVSITISPNTEAAFSEAIFSLHIPIEKRALDLPLFSDSYEDEIAKTEDLLAKLDKIIDNVGKITEYWKKFCFVTFAVVWVKNFFSGVFGGSGAVARERTNEAFEKKYDEYRNLGTEDPKNCRALSYDECVFKNQAEYDHMISQSQTAINAANKGDYNQEAFKDLGKEYDDSKKNLGYYGNLVSQDPSNQQYRDKYYELDARLTRASEEKKFTDKFFTEGRIKTYDEVKASGVDADKIVGTYKKDIVEKFNPPKDKQEDNAFLWRTYSTRFLPLQRETDINTNMKTHLEDVQKKGTSLGAPTEKDNDYIGKLKESYGVITTTQLGEFKHNPNVAVLDQGRQKGYTEFISIDAFNYLQVSYNTAGRPTKYDLYKRSQPNGRMGSPSDVYLGVVDGQLMDRYQKIKSEKDNPDKGIYDNIKKGQDCVGVINKKNAGGKYSRGEVIPLQSVDCGGLGAYTIDTAAASIGASCTEFMSPGDCKLLFNACDPVICPPSRCNLGGEWQVDNVIQTGIIGSALLCLPNFGIEPLGIGKPGGVVMPICLSGIYAGLQNIRSVIEGYRQCLITSKVSGRSVGICDRLRSYGICEILWKEGLALFSAKKGIFRNIVNFFLGKSGSGGGEYSSFEKAVDSSVGSLQYFTQSYAKNTFAMYNGGALPELGTEICKAAIFGKAPGLGNMFDQISKPESPPQFTAFFDEAPYSDLGNQPLSQYKVTYHIYAGDNEDIIYSVYMQALDPYTGQFIIQPHVLKDSKGITQNRRLPRGSFADESPDVILPSGMKEICVEINSKIYGRKVECGFGKVSTSFAIDYISDQFAQNEAKKQISTSAQCVPTSPPTITELGAVEGTAGTVSSGFIQSGIIRKCSKYNPGVGGDEVKWSPVGTCGEDDRERDLGTCWLYVPAAKNAIKEVSARLDLNTSLAKTAQEVVNEAEKQGETIPGYYILKKEDIALKEKEADAIIKNANTPNAFESGRAIYQQVIGSALLDDPDGARMQFKLAESYELEARISLKKQTSVTTTTVRVPALTSLSQTEINNDKETKIILKGSKFDEIFGIEASGTILDPKDFPMKRLNENEIELTIASGAAPNVYNLKVINVNGQKSSALTLTIKSGTSTQTIETTKEVCSIIETYWSDGKNVIVEVLQGRNVYLSLEWRGDCKDELVMATVMKVRKTLRMDWLARDEIITTLGIPFNEPNKQTWKALLTNDEEDEEYYFIALSRNGQEKTSETIKVKRAIPNKNVISMPTRKKQTSTEKSLPDNNFQSTNPSTITSTGTTSGSDFNKILNKNPSQQENSIFTTNTQLKDTSEEIQTELLSCNPNGNNAEHPLGMTISLFIDRDYAECANTVLKAKEKGATAVNIIPTLKGYIDKNDRVKRYMWPKTYPNAENKIVDNENIEYIKEKLTACFSAVLDNDMDLSIRPHLDYGGDGEGTTWRNGYIFNPVENLAGYSYKDVLLEPIAIALHDALAQTRSTNIVDFTMQGEMGRTLFEYTSNWLSLVKEYRAKMPKNVRIGINTNFNNLNGKRDDANLFSSDEEKIEFQKLIDVVDILGLSAYYSVSYYPQQRDFKAMKEYYLKTFKNNDIKIPVKISLQFSEIGIGGGSGDMVDAIRNPWKGVSNCNDQSSPWKTQSMIDLRRAYYAQLLSALNEGFIDRAFTWNADSWDVQELYRTAQCGDETIAKMIENYNQGCLR